jgi:hypothetical protein
MDPLSSTPDAQAKSPGFAPDFLSSITAELGNGGTASSLFANLLSQTQVPETLPSDPAANAQPPPPSNSQPPQLTQPPQSPQSPQQDATGATNTADTTNNADPTVDTANTNNTNDAAPSDKGANAKTAVTSNQAPTGKSLRHDAAKRNNSKQGSQDVGDGVSSPSSASNTLVAADQKQPDSETLFTSILPTASSVGDTTTSAPDHPTAPSTDGTTAPTPNDKGVLTVDNPLGLGTGDTNFTPVLAVTASQSQTVNVSADAPSENTSLPSASNGSAANNNLVSSDPELAALLLQLEHFAAQHLANTAPATNNTLSVSATPTSNTNASPTTKTDMAPAKTDLKTLLTALDNAKFGNQNGPSNNLTTGLSADASTPATTPATTSTPTPEPQNTVPKTDNAPATNAGNTGLTNDDLLALFNPAGNLDNAGFTYVPPPASGIPLAGAGDNDTSLDTNAQGQGSPSNNTTNNAQIGNNSTTLAAGAPQSASPYDFASQLSALRASKGGATGLPTPVEQVILQMGRAAKDGSNQMTIQLRPAELGRIDVKLNVSSDGKVQGTVTADNSATLGLLLKDVRSLERALQEAGLRADPGSLQFNLRGDGQPGNGSGQMANGQSGGDGNNSGASSNATSLPVVPDLTETYYLTPGGVNMRV